jgi:hypothetical protein
MLMGEPYRSIDHMPVAPFSIANLIEAGQALYGPNWEEPLSDDLKVPERSIRRWCEGSALPDLRDRLAAICRQMAIHNLAFDELARKLESLGPPE